MSKQTEYHFSKIVLFFATILMVAILVVPVSLFIKFYEEDLLISVLFLLPLIVFVIAIKDYIRFMYCLIISRPALVLTRESLINNADGSVYFWSEIKTISYEQYKGFNAPPGGYIQITLKSSDRIIQIPNNSIKCKTVKLLQDLQYFHRTFRGKKRK